MNTVSPTVMPPGPEHADLLEDLRSDQSRARWNDRAHFLALAAVAMRHILADRARFRQAAKRSGKHLRS